jgi:hypothetical protein
MRIVAFIENPQVVRAILEHLSLWDEPRPPPALVAAPGAPVEFEYLPWVERSSPGSGAAVCRSAGVFGGASGEWKLCAESDPGRALTSVLGSTTILP